METVLKAIRVATKAHEGQLRRFPDASGRCRPFINHPARVASIISMYCYNADLLAAAWLHDTVEDTSLELWMLSEMFDGNIVRLVKGMTQLEGQTKLDYMKTFHSNNASPSLRALKLADRLANLEECYLAHPEFRKNYIEGTNTLLNIIRHGGYDYVAKLHDAVSRELSLVMAYIPCSKSAGND